MDDVANINLPDLLSPAARPQSVTLNTTFRCNLRCVYCPTTHESWHGEDAAPDVMNSLVEYIVDAGVKNVMLGLWGDTLTSPDWVKYIEPLADAGVRLRIHSGFGRLLAAEEIALLARFETITMSIDTPDRDLLKELRKGLDVRTFIYNLHMIRAHGLARYGREPHVVWAAVMTDRMLPHLTELVGFCISNKVGHLMFNDLGDYGFLETGLKSIFDLDDRAFLNASMGLEDALRLAADKGLSVDVPFADRIRARIQKIVKGSTPMDNAWNDCVGTVELIPGKAEFHYAPLTEGTTRNCTVPWDTPMVAPDGKVMPCCLINEPMGQVKAGTSLMDVMKDEPYRKLREDMLSGKFGKRNCQTCPIHPPVPIQEFEQRVSGLLGHNGLEP